MCVRVERSPAYLQFAHVCLLRILAQLPHYILGRCRVFFSVAREHKVERLVMIIRRWSFDSNGKRCGNRPLNRRINSQIHGSQVPRMLVLRDLLDYVNEEVRVCEFELYCGELLEREELENGWL